MSDFVQGGTSKPVEHGGDQECGDDHASTQTDGRSSPPIDTRRS